VRILNFFVPSWSNGNYEGYADLAIAVGMGHMTQVPMGRKNTRISVEKFFSGFLI